MDSSLMQVLAFALLPVAAMVLGGVVASWRTPGPGLRSALQHLAAGVVVAVVAVEMLPDIRRDQEPAVVGVGFAVGVAAMLGLRWLSRREDEGPRSPNGLVAAMSVDVAVDGLLLGIGFAAGAAVGQLLAMALALEGLSLGLALAATLGQLGVSRGRSISTVAAVAFLFLAGGTVGATLLSRLGGAVLAGVLAFGAAALLYLVTEELLAEAHEVPDTAVASALFFVGFLIFLLLGMVM